MEIASELLDRQLIACANLIPITSVYRWEGKVQNEDEVVLIAKTKTEAYDKLRQAIEELHPYEVPCILHLDAPANEAFSHWVIHEVEG